MTTKGNHLTMNDRVYIEEALNENVALIKVADRLCKDPRTISKEIKRNRIVFGKMRRTGYIGCIHQKHCKEKDLCSAKCGRKCKKCTTNKCYPICEKYTPKECIRLTKYPHVCNGCPRKPGCMFEKYRYIARTAHETYIERLSTTREGIAASADEIESLDRLITPLIQNGQSIAHIYAHHKDDICCSKRTLYSYFDQSLFSVRNIDLPRKVKYKPRRKKPSQTLAIAKHRRNRTFKDFTRFIEENPDFQVVEMDTVHGAKGKKTLLTMFFRNSSMMLGFLLEECTNEAVGGVIDGLYKALGTDVFRKSFPVILTDNGPEFKSYERIERDVWGKRRTYLFYCDPMASHQKGRIEKNHEYIRYITPKGQSFKDLTQEDITLMMNHINSTARASLNDKTPFKLAQMLHDERLLEACSLELIHADDVHLKPSLIKAK